MEHIAAIPALNNISKQFLPDSHQSGNKGPCFSYFGVRINGLPEVNKPCTVPLATVWVKDNPVNAAPNDCHTEHGTRA